MSVDLAATFAPPTVPLRDWLREQFAATVGTDANGTEMVYVGGLPDAAYAADGTLRGTAVALYTAGGTDGGVALDRPFVRFNVWAESAATAEAAAYSLRALLDRTLPGTALGLAASPSAVRLIGADTPPPIWAPDPDLATPRFVVTSTITVQAVAV